jgi:hypothetical protein
MKNAEDEAWDEIERRQSKQKPKPVADYSESLIKLNAAINQYRSLIGEKKYQLAANVAVEMQFLTMQLQEWVEQQNELIYIRARGEK